MYNRYIRNDRGDYACVNEPPLSPPEAAAEGPARSSEESGGLGGLGGLVKRLLGRFKLDGLDRGDLLLLLLLLLLFTDGEDDELLIALALLFLL